MKYFTPVSLPKFEGLLPELENLIEKKIIAWGSGNQICITTTPNDSENYLLGCGSLRLQFKYLKSGTDNKISTIISEPRDNKLIEEDFSILCTQFKNTIIEEVFDVLKSNYVLGRVRFMLAEPKTCLSWHVDRTTRLHYPIKTQTGCFMVIEDELFHLAEHEWCMTNTIASHTAFNASLESRIHLVATIIKEL